MTAGLDSMTGTPRFTFGMMDLQAGIPFLPAMIGLFAIPQIIAGLTSKGSVIPKYDKKNYRYSAEIFRYRKKDESHPYRLIYRRTGIGAIPGAGGAIAVFLAYDASKKISKDKEKLRQRLS